jgi:hypothetical protein
VYRIQSFAEKLKFQIGCAAHAVWLYYFPKIEMPVRANAPNAPNGQNVPNPYRRTICVYPLSRILCTAKNVEKMDGMIKRTNGGLWITFRFSREFVTVESGVVVNGMRIRRSQTLYRKDSNDKWCRNAISIIGCLFLPAFGILNDLE